VLAAGAEPSSPQTLVLGRQVVVGTLTGTAGI
jgi:hypothetical protein